MRILVETKNIFVADKDYKIFIYEDTEEMKYYANVENTNISVSANTKQELTVLVEQNLFR